MRGGMREKRRRGEWFFHKKNKERIEKIK